jgi:hypothetical protein
MFERGNEPRTPVSLKAVALFSGLRRECLVINRSPRGARLRFHGFVGLPDRFELSIPEECATFQATVAWRHETDVGVTMDQIAGADRPAAGAILQRINDLEAELRDLRARLGSPPAQEG